MENPMRILQRAVRAASHGSARRRMAPFVFGVFATFCCLMLHCVPVRGQAASSASLALSAVYKAFKIEQSLFSQASQAKWQRKTTEQLKQILGNTQEILRELRQLRFDIKSDLEQQFVHEVNVSLKADVNQLLYENLTSLRRFVHEGAKAQRHIETIFDHVQNDTNRASLAGGAAAYEITLAGLLAEEAFFHYTAGSVVAYADQQNTFEIYSKQFKMWGDSKLGGTPGYLIEQEKRGQHDDLKRVDAVIGPGVRVFSYKEPFTLGTMGFIHTSPWFPHIFFEQVTATIRITGGIAQGFVVSVQSLTPNDRSTATEAWRDAGNERNSLQKRLDSLHSDYVSRGQQIAALIVVQNQLYKDASLLHGVAEAAGARAATDGRRKLLQWCSGAASAVALVALVAVLLRLRRVPR